MKSLLRFAIPLFALAACATSKESGPPTQTPPAPAAQREAEKPSAAPAPAAPASGATTASEAAERVHEEWVKTHGGHPGGAGGDPCVCSHCTRERKAIQRFVSRKAFNTVHTNQRLRQSRTRVPTSNQ